MLVSCYLEKLPISRNKAKSYKRGKPKKPDKDYLEIFLQSRQARGVSPKTLRYYRERLSKFVARVEYTRATRQDIEEFLNSIPPNQYGLGNRHATYRALRVFYRWLSTEYELPNPVAGVARTHDNRPRARVAGDAGQLDEGHLFRGV